MIFCINKGLNTEIHGYNAQQWLSFVVTTVTALATDYMRTCGTQSSDGNAANEDDAEYGVEGDVDCEAEDGGLEEVWHQ